MLFEYKNVTKSAFFSAYQNIMQSALFFAYKNVPPPLCQFKKFHEKSRNANCQALYV